MLECMLCIKFQSNPTGSEDLANLCPYFLYLVYNATIITRQCSPSSSRAHTNSVNTNYLCIIKSGDSNTSPYKNTDIFIYNCQVK